MKNYFLVIAYLVIFFEVDGQSTDVLSKKYEAYQAVWPKTKLQLIFNQDKYAAGDTVFFKAYFLNENLTAIKDIQIINLDVVNFKGESVIQFLFKVDNGTGQNQIFIPSDMPAGIYFVTAYSNWMKNFDSDLIFKKSITIVNAKQIVAVEKREPTMAVEGGHLVRDIVNTVGIITHAAGSAVRLIDEADQEMGKTITDKNGVGIITFVPKSARSYAVQINGIVKKILLPEVEEDGIAVTLVHAAPNEQIKISIACAANSALRKNAITLFVGGIGKAFYTTSVQMGNQQSMEILIPEEVQKNLPDGIIQLSFLNDANELIASRDFYNQRMPEANASVTVAKNSFQTREKVTLEVNIKDAKGQPIEGEFSIGVLNNSLFNARKDNSLKDVLNIPTGVKDNFLIDRQDADWLTSLNNLLIVDTKPLPWKEILAREVVKPRSPFSSTILKKGRVFIGSTNQPAPDNTKIMFYLNKDLLHYETFTLGGKVMLTVPDIYGHDEFFYFAEEQYGKEIPSIRIEWENDPVVLPHASLFKETENQDTYAAFAEKKKLINRSYGFYNISKTNMAAKKTSSVDVTTFENEIAEADITIDLSDYAEFPTMTEVVKEVIPSLRRRIKDGKNTLLVSLSEPMPMPVTDPLFIIDGIATRSSAFFLSLKPTDVVAVKIINNPKKLVPLGLMGKTGIVLIQTKQGNAREPLEDSTKVIIGLNKPLGFPSYDYSTEKNLRAPDFRSTIFWNPSVKTDSNGKATIEFYCSDDVGRMSIRVDGIATGAKPFSAEQTIEVMAEPSKN